MYILIKVKYDHINPNFVLYFFLTVSEKYRVQRKYFFLCIQKIIKIYGIFLRKVVFFSLLTDSTLYKIAWDNRRIYETSLKSTKLSQKPFGNIIIDIIFILISYFKLYYFS